MAQSQGIHDVVVAAGRDLHQAREALEAPVRVVLQIDSNLDFLRQGSTHLLQLLHRLHKGERRLVQGRGPPLLSGLLQLCFRRLEVINLPLVRMAVAFAPIGGTFGKNREGLEGVRLVLEHRHEGRVAVVDLFTEGQLWTDHILRCQQMDAGRAGRVLFVPAGVNCLVQVHVHDNDIVWVFLHSGCFVKAVPHSFQHTVIDVSKEVKLLFQVQSFKLPFPNQVVGQ